MIAILIQETATDSRVVLFDWINSKIKAAALFPAQLVQKVSFSPAEKDIILTTGVGHFRIWKILDG